jgi:hypothetical protein
VAAAQHRLALGKHDADLSREHRLRPPHPPLRSGHAREFLLLFTTEGLRRSRRLIWKLRLRIPGPRREFDFSGGHMTHSIPTHLAELGFDWHTMNVYVSNDEPEAFFTLGTDATL